MSMFKQYFVPRNVADELICSVKLVFRTNISLNFIEQMHEVE